MKTFHPLSFGIGFSSGLLILVFVFGAMHIFGGPARGSFPPNEGNFQQMRGANGSGGPNTAMMAERFGMTEAELQAELDSGKTMQQIAVEHGVEFPRGGRGMMSRSGMAPSSASGATATSTGNTAAPTSSSSSVSQ